MEYRDCSTWNNLRDTWKITVVADRLSDHALIAVTVDWDCGGRWRLDSLRVEAIEADLLPPTERSIVLAALEIQFRLIQERIVELKRKTTA